MPRFAYTAKDANRNPVEGTIEADNETAAITRLSGMGIYPLSLTEVTALTQSRRMAPMLTARKVPAGALAYFNRQLADLLGGGLSLFNALKLVAEQTEHPLLRRVVAEVGDAVRDGQAFSEAMGRHPQVFAPLSINMVRAGETGGSLDAVLTRLADLAESESELKNRVATALVYPAFVLLVGAAMTIFLLTYVIPRLAMVFTESDQILPLPTRMLLAISHGLSQWWWVWTVGALAAGWGFQRFRLSPAGRVAIDRFVLRLPLFGVLVRKLETARFTRNLGVMVGQGVPLLQALDVTGATVTNTALSVAVQGIRDAVRDGANLAAAVSGSGQFPVFVSNMVAVGEESGTLETALLKVAGAYERETDRALRVLTTILEPLLIVLVGLVVMFIVISMLLPIFQLGLVAQ